MVEALKKEAAWLGEPERGAWVPLWCFEHHELQSIGRFWYQELRDFL